MIALSIMQPHSLKWNEEDKIDVLAKKLRGLSPRQFTTVTETINTLIDKLSDEA